MSRSKLDIADKDEPCTRNSTGSGLSGRPPRPQRHLRYMASFTSPLFANKKSRLQGPSPGPALPSAGASPEPKQAPKGCAKTYSGPANQCSSCNVEIDH